MGQYVLCGSMHQYSLVCKKPNGVGCDSVTVVPNMSAVGDALMMQVLALFGVKHFCPYLE